MSKIAIVSDHAGYELKEYLKPFIEKLGYEVVDFGTYSPESCDYPDFAHPAATALEEGKVNLGIGMCGSGNGMQITLNKHQGVRAALCWLPELAKLAKEHNDANFLVLPARFITKEEAQIIVETYLNSTFEGGRHARRVKKIPLNISVEGEVMG
ncbi:MAG: ribose 5-phosphate isomerase B [Muribaculaceae bacterium]|nr:ribose 5-phosphate isomerase B [Muribaculaceae bacterium]